MFKEKGLEIAEIASLTGTLLLLQLLIANQPVAEPLLYMHW